MSKLIKLNLLVLILLAGCNRGVVVNKAPTIECDSTVIATLGNRFNISDYVNCDGQLTVNGTVITLIEGDYQIRLVAENEKSISVKTVTVKVEPMRTPEPTSEPLIEPSIEPSEEPEMTATPEPTPTVASRPTATPQTVHAPTSTPYVEEQPSYEDVGHGTEYFSENDYGDIFEAQNACKARLNELPYGSCEPSNDETYYVLNY